MASRICWRNAFKKHANPERRHSKIILHATFIEKTGQEPFADTCIKLLWHGERGRRSFLAARLECTFSSFLQSTSGAFSQLPPRAVSLSLLGVQEKQEGTYRLPAYLCTLLDRLAGNVARYSQPHILARCLPHMNVMDSVVAWKLRKMKFILG